MYNKALNSFLEIKQVDKQECIQAYLDYEGITDFKAKHAHKVIALVESKWPRFASFVDRSIRDGKIKGKPVKINTYYAEQKERTEKIHEEFVAARLTDEQQAWLNIIQHKGVSIVHSLIGKAKQNPVGKDYAYTSKTLQWLPLVNQAISLQINLPES